MGTTICGDLRDSSPRTLPKQESGGRYVGLSASIVEFMKLGCFLRDSSPRTLPKQESGGRYVGLSASIVEFMKLGCLVKKKKRQHPTNNKEVKKDPLLKNTGNILTLQEWILASPNRNGCNSRVYPTFEKNDEGLSKKPGDSFSVGGVLIMEVDEGDKEMEDSSSRSSLNGKTEKRVRFRLPVVADIFILDSPGGYSAM